MTPTEPEDMYVYRASIRLRNGKRIYAAKYGLKAFRIKIRKRTTPPNRP